MGLTAEEAEPARPVVVGLDDSPAAFAAAAAGAELAAARGLPLRLVRALEADGAAAEGARHRLELAAASVGSGLPEGAVTAVVRSGPADLVLLHESRSATVVVVGTAGDDTVPGSELGPVAAALVRRAACPVLVHRPVSGRSGVVVGVSGAPGTAALLAAAARAAARRSALLVLHAWSRAGATDQAAVDRDERALLEGYVESLRQSAPEVAVDLRVDHGRPEDSLLEASQEAELVVVGRAHRDRTCTAATVAAQAAAPVLVVPLPPGGPVGDRRGATRSTTARSTPR